MHGFMIATLLLFTAASPASPAATDAGTPEASPDSGSAKAQAIPPAAPRKGGDLQFGGGPLRAGAILFRAGAGAGGPDGDIVFVDFDKSEALRLCGDGRAFVRGKPTSSLTAIRAAFSAWLRRVVPRCRPLQFGRRSPAADWFSLGGCGDDARLMQFLFLGAGYGKGLFLAPDSSGPGAIAR